MPRGLVGSGHGFMPRGIVRSGDGFVPRGLRVDCPNIRIANNNLFWFLLIVEGLLSHTDHPRKSPFVLWA